MSPDHVTSCAVFHHVSFFHHACLSYDLEGGRFSSRERSSIESRTYIGQGSSSRLPFFILSTSSRNGSICKADCGVRKPWNTNTATVCFLAIYLRFDGFNGHIGSIILNTTFNGRRCSCGGCCSDIRDILDCIMFPAIGVGCGTQLEFVTQVFTDDPVRAQLKDYPCGTPRPFRSKCWARYACGSHTHMNYGQKAPT